MREIGSELFSHVAGPCSDGDVETGGPQRGDAATCYPRVRILDADDDPADPGRHDRAGARRSATVMDARLERHRQGAAGGARRLQSRR